MYSSSSAFCWPTTAGSVTLIANPWWMPSSAKFAANLRFWGGNPEVRRQRQAEPAADGGALDRGDDRERLLEQPDREVVQMRAVRTADRVSVAEVSPGAEDPARAAQHDRAAPAAGGKVLAGGRELLDQPDAEEVARRPADLQRRHVVIAELNGQLGCRGVRVRHQLSLPPAPVLATS